MRKILFVAIFFAISFGASAQNKLTIIVDGIEEIKGTLRVAIFNKEDARLEDYFKRVVVDVESRVEEVIVDLPSGEYSISMYQDENDNKKMETGAYGIPTEKYGFSNNAVGNMGPPTYSDMKISVDKDKVVRITMK